jgi:hypothetical protein
LALTDWNIRKGCGEEMSDCFVPDHEKSNHNVIYNSPNKSLEYKAYRVSESVLYKNAKTSLSAQTGYTVTKEPDISSRHPFAPREA